MLGGGLSPMSEHHLVAGTHTSKNMHWLDGNNDSPACKEHCSVPASVVQFSITANDLGSETRLPVQIPLHRITSGLWKTAQDFCAPSTRGIKRLNIYKALRTVPSPQ